MELDLVDRRGDAGLADDPLQMVAVEIGDADRAHPPLPMQAHKRFPAVDVPVDPRPRPMDEVEIGRAAQPLCARLERAQGFVEAMVAVAELGGDNDVRPAFERLAHTLLVAVHGGGVDGAVAERDRPPDDFSGGLGRRLEHPQPELRHRRPVVDGDYRLGRISHGALLCKVAAKYRRARSTGASGLAARSLIASAAERGYSDAPGLSSRKPVPRSREPASS